MNFPAGVEDFASYNVDELLEQSSDKTVRDYLDVTSGALTCKTFDSAKRGQMTMSPSGGFRAVALGYPSGNANCMEWTDQAISYRFQYAAASDPGVNPGFKAFVRYITENDLYVFSWRFDGFLKLEKVVNDVYSTLFLSTADFAPSANVWHTLRFQAKGNELKAYCDGILRVTVLDDTHAYGTCGIRTDATDGAYISDWKVFNP